MVMIRTISVLTTMARLSIVSDLIQIYNSSVSAVLPQKLIKNFVSFNPRNEELCINGSKFSLLNKKLFVVGAGKAVQYMAREIDALLADKIENGIISIPEGSLAPDTKSKNLKYYEGAKNNLPDFKAMKTAIKIKELASNLSTNDVLLVLISGGGSALLPLPKKPITLDEKTDLIKKLANSGADIKELNTVRKRISDIKGGKLAIYANPAETISLVLSDIVGDPLDMLASGPTVQNKDHPEAAIKVLNQYLDVKDFSNSIKQVLSEKCVPEVFPGDNTHNFILGSNNISLLGAKNESQNLKYFPIMLSNTVTGNVKDLAQEYVSLAKCFTDYLVNGDTKKLKSDLDTVKIPGIKTDFLETLEPKQNKSIILILGGEPTVEVKGTGLGGRNQQLALEFSIAIHDAKDNFKNFDVHFLSAGTDGIDGPTDAAGAIGYLELIEDSISDKINAYKYADHNDTYNFYKKFRNGTFHVIKGHTNTNVMDVHLLAITYKPNNKL